MSSTDENTADTSTHSHESLSGVECCSHHELTSEKWIVLYMVGGLMVFATTIARWLNLADTQIAMIPAAIGALILSAGLFYAAGKELLNNRVSSSTLAAFAILAAIATGKYEAAGYIAFILLLFDQALRRTAWGARRAIEELVGLTPDIARVVDENGEREIGLEDVAVGMTVRVRPGENLPVDGTVLTGESMVNQASLTGEAVPVAVQEGTAVYAGTTNLSGGLDVTVTSVGADTTIGKVASLIEEAESARTPRQLLIEQVARYFVPVAAVTSLLVWWLTQDVDVAIVVLIVVCPSALLISSPTAMMAAFAAAARLGIMIKQTNDLEAASTVDTVVLDKTGTLTTGQFAVSKLAPAEGVSGADLLQAAADAEAQSNHPLAVSILDTAKQARVTPNPDARHEELHGRGVKATGEGFEIFAGRPTWLAEINEGIKGEIESVESKIEGMSGVHVMRNGQYLGAVGLEDRLRYNAKGVLEKLRDLGIRQIAVFTGDRFSVAKRVGLTVGADSIEAECLPEEKHQLVNDLTAKGRRVLMVGDGINDGPSLAAADVGVAMGLSGSDIAANSAGIALMNDDLSRIPFLIMLGRKTRTIVAQNIALSIMVALIGLIIAATGQIGLGAAAFYHFLGDVIVIGNSFRLIRFGEDYANATQSLGADMVAQNAEGNRAGSAQLRNTGTPATNAS